MCGAFEILKDGSQIVYVSDDIETYDDLSYDPNPELPLLDLTKVKSYDILLKEPNQRLFTNRLNQVLMAI